MRIRLAIVLILPIALSGCFHSAQEPEIAQTGTHMYATEEFRLEIPNEWEILTSKDFTSTASPGTVVAFRSPVRNARFTANVVVIRNTLSTEIKTLDYAKFLRQRLAQDLSNYAAVGQEEVQMNVSGIATPTLLIKSSGSESPQADVKIFAHKAGVKGLSAFVIASAHRPDEQENIISDVERMVSSFEVK